MSKVYNNQIDFARAISNFLHSVCPFLHKPALNIIPHIIFGMISSESSVVFDIAKQLKFNFSLVQPDSVSRRIRRFFNNPNFNPYQFYDAIIRYVISSYKTKHADKRVHIIIDHMFSHRNYTVFMISMRIGKQGIPLWFRCFSGFDSPDIFKDDLILEGIKYVSSLFDDSFDLIFLGDRFFNSSNVMRLISSLGHTFCFRLKSHYNIRIFDSKENHFVWKRVSNLTSYKYKSAFYPDIYFTKSLFKANIVISKSDDVPEPWYVITNGDCNKAIKDYNYRFGGIESLFKNQKSNGFHIESINNASITAFTNMYTLVCFSTLFLTILGCHYSKNKNNYQHVKIITHKIRDGKKVRVMSLFKTGLSLIKLAFNSLKYIYIPYSFVLYDI